MCYAAWCGEVMLIYVKYLISISQMMPWFDCGIHEKTIISAAVCFSIVTRISQQMINRGSKMELECPLDIVKTNSTYITSLFTEQFTILSSHTNSCYISLFSFAFSQWDILRFLLNCDHKVFQNITSIYVGRAFSYSWNKRFQFSSNLMSTRLSYV